MEAVGECCLLYVARSVCSTAQDDLPRDGTDLNGLCPPTSIINQENAPTDFPTGDLVEAFSNIVSVQLEKTKNKKNSSPGLPTRGDSGLHSLLTLQAIALPRQN